VIEGRLAEPELGKIEAFLKEPKGRSRAEAGFKELPDVKAERERKAKRAERKAAGRETTLEEPHARALPEEILVEFSGRHVPRDCFEVVRTETGLVILHTLEDRQPLAERS
jgi:hypothetical protein